MKYQPEALDYNLSPYTGLTRDSWIKACEYLIGGIFSNIKSFTDPVVMPRKETEVTYPHKNATEAVKQSQRKAEIFEGLARSFFIAAPLIKNNPDIEICGYSLKEYYKQQVLRICTRGDDIYVGTYQDQVKISGNTNPFACFQQTVETCALVICLNGCKQAIWDTYTQSEKDTIAEFISSYAHTNTVPQNWRLFNMLDLAFLHNEGYPIDKDIMRDHAQTILNYYAGGGWYRDGHSFDYYSCWAFNVYAPIWNVWYGYENEPYIAKRFEENSNELMKTYPHFFDRDGFTNMWGRSNIYRNAATSPFDANMILPQHMDNPGWARRIASGSLLQFLTRDDFLYNGVPTLGFYGQFTPLVQGYSCAESPLWLGKAFLCLNLDADNPFWTAVENNGVWENMDENGVCETVLDGPALCTTNHCANGETILRSGKIVKNTNNMHAMWNYSKLCYNTKYPWESAPCDAVEAQQYVLEDLTDKRFERCNATFWAGCDNGILYRRQFFNYNLATDMTWTHAVNLADFAVPYGIVRVDKLRLFKRPVSMTLGAYGFSDNGTEIIKKTSDGARAIILKGHDHTGREKQLAMTIYDGWDEIAYINSTGTNPDSEKSIIVYAKLTRKKQYGYEPYIMISQVITKESCEDFSDDELFPVKEVIYTDPQKCGGYGPITLNMKNGDTRVIEFEGIEGKLSL